MHGVGGRIFGFEGLYRWLDIGFACPLDVQDIVYPSVAHAFAAARTKDLRLRLQIATAETPAIAIAMSRVLKVREDWPQIEDASLRYLLKLKYTRYPILRGKLLETVGLDLVYANRLGDLKLGVDRERGIGENRLGRLTMDVRDELSRLAA